MGIYVHACPLPHTCRPVRLQFVHTNIPSRTKSSGYMRVLHHILTNSNWFDPIVRIFGATFATLQYDLNEWARQMRQRQRLYDFDCAFASVGERIATELREAKVWILSVKFVWVCECVLQFLTLPVIGLVPVGDENRIKNFTLCTIWMLSRKRWTFERCATQTKYLSKIT